MNLKKIINKEYEDIESKDTKELVIQKEEKSITDLIHLWDEFSHFVNNQTVSFDLEEGHKFLSAEIREKNIEYSSNCVTQMSLLVPTQKYGEKISGEYFKRIIAGIFLSTLINVDYDRKTYKSTTEKLEKNKETYQLITKSADFPIDYLGFKNYAEIEIIGNVGDCLGYRMREGTITLKGNADYDVCKNMEGGIIAIEGFCVDIGRNWSGGKLFIQGKECVNRYLPNHSE